MLRTFVAIILVVFAPYPARAQLRYLVEIKKSAGFAAQLFREACLDTPTAEKALLVFVRQGWATNGREDIPTGLEEHVSWWQRFAPQAALIKERRPERGTITAFVQQNKDGSFTCSVGVFDSNTLDLLNALLAPGKYSAELVHYPAATALEVRLDGRTIEAREFAGVHRLRVVRGAER